MQLGYTNFDLPGQGVAPRVVPSNGPRMGRP
jgi:hypothetical protein